MRALMLTTVLAMAGCGFDCAVQGETEHFNDCDALQSRYDAEVDAAVRDDIDTCGELSGCEIRP